MADKADDDNDFAAMFAASEGNKRAKRPKVGDLVKGTIVTLGKDAVFVDLGGKAEGELDRAQVSDHEGKLLVKIGDVIEARVAADSGGVLSLRTKLGRGPEARAELAQAQELGIPVEGLVTEVVKGGLSVDVAGVRGFCPASQIDTHFVEDLSVYIGQRLTFRITRYESRNLVLSRRALLEEDNEKRAVETRKNLIPGAVIRGRVTSFKPYGAFVDIGGIEGMLHVSELGYGRVDKPEDVLHAGQELDVAILKVEGDRISLSLKVLGDDPWNTTTGKLAEGQRVKGTITRLQPFGAFVEIAPGVEGLVHISELGAGRRINHPKEIVSVGQAVEATVLGIDQERRRLSLSLASSNDAAPDEVAAVKHAPQKLGTFGDLLSRKK
ncbi:MAG TPA: S1 RNA-binding domain-containing protein [Kofleriaceae bacterium]|jgi:small subunit ribosomal protein S1|nr:S1 RNA-binding domain-containing protein [Kofleriaceae bacterium]